MYENNENYQNYQNYQNDQYQPTPTGKPKKSGAGKIVALALCCSLFGGIIGAGGTFALTKGTDIIKSATSSPSTVYESSRETEPLNVAFIAPDKELTASEVYAKNVGSTVGITTSIDTNFFGYRTTAAASGSGFVLTEDGYIVTNYHVIADANSVTVATYDGKSYSADIVGYDEDNDLAILKIDASGLTPVVLGSSEKSNVGDGVCAIGNPLGELTFSLTTGVISALDRTVTIEGTQMNLIQTDCAINAGNSGGPLFNMYGEVIGITNAKLSNTSSGETSIDNIAFAIPIDSIKSMITSIITDGTVEKPYIGVTIATLGSEYQRFGLSGVSVQSVEEDSPAEEAGLKPDDIITAVNGEKITQNSDLTTAVAKSADGDKLRLTVSRQGAEQEITVTVRVKKQSALKDEEEKDDGDGEGGAGEQTPENGGNDFEDFEDFFGGRLFPWFGSSGSGSPM